MNLLILISLLGLCNIALSDKDSAHEEELKNTFYVCDPQEGCYGIETDETYDDTKAGLGKTGDRLFKTDKDCEKACDNKWA